jgi:hypothetical protein
MRNRVRGVIEHLELKVDHLREVEEYLDKLEDRDSLQE